MMKLDTQAKDLANLNRQAAVLNHQSTAFRRTSLRSQLTGHTSRPLGTRISARLRGTAEEEWQSVPKEWLNENRNSLRNGKTGLESDEDTVSDLTELSEEVSGSSKPNSPSLSDKLAESPTIENREKSGELQVLHDTCVEWETVGELHLASPSSVLISMKICTTLDDWKRITVRLEKATHHSEKALYKVLSHDIVPTATQELRVRYFLLFDRYIQILRNQEVEQKRRLEEVLVHRKRSSRIASKESEREEARLVAKKKQEEEGKLTRARRMEARLQKEEAGRLKRENAREQRRKERDAREQSKKAVTFT